MTTPQFPKPDQFAVDERVRFVSETGCYTFVDPADGMEYEFDLDKGAWFPMWNESLVEQQQSAYEGSAQQASDGADIVNQGGHKRKGGGKDSHRQRENTSVYVSGLPLDATEDEVNEYFSQCGAIMPDILTNKPRVKLYRNSDDTLKGDALVTFFKAPSVQLAIDILDDSQFRAKESTRISAQFKDKEKQVDGPDKAKRARVDAKSVQKRLGRLEKRLDWFEGGEEVAERHKRTVILAHMFTLEEIEEDVTLVLDLAEDVRTECEKLGTVTSVKVYDMSESGIVAVKFKDELPAQACVQAMNGRFFAGRQIEASIYDGRTRYKSSAKVGRVSGKNKASVGGHLEADGGNSSEFSDDEHDEEEEEEEKRMEKYSQWLESQR
ncbi:hypothetical protein IWW57_002291 [Coemansia sp. S610]|nr:hypothetical protein IWW57_002291 [Coemansia sp. S610]KAJ2699172.1 hypothetical protein H4218_002796 [Coemansia sp. IMI 209128]